MLDSDRAKVLAVLKDHFPKATDADGSLVWESVRGYALDDATRAVKEHRIERGSIVTRPDIKRVRTLAATYYREHAPKRTEQTIWQAVCVEDPFSSENHIADLTNHFCRAWDEVKETVTDERGRAGARAMILRNATIAFGQEGMAPKDAEIQAREIVELAPGERVILESVFKTQAAPNTSAAKAEAIKQLAGAA